MMPRLRAAFLLLLALCCAAGAFADAGSKQPTQRVLLEVLVPSMKRWMEEEGAEIESIDVKESGARGGGLGLFAGRDFVRGELLVALPFSMMLNVEDVRDRPNGRKIREFVGEEEKTNLLALYLLAEKAKGKKSTWSKWIGTLPAMESMESMLRWDADDLAWLQNSRLVDNVWNRKRRAHLTWQDTVTKLSEKYPRQFPKEQFTLEAVEYALSLIWSRTFGVDLPPDYSENAVAFAPLIDMTNSNWQEFNVGFGVNQEYEQFEFFCLKDVSRGQELIVNYGPYSNSHNLMQYGFTYESAARREAHLNLSLSLTDEKFGQKMETLHRNKLTTNLYQYEITSPYLTQPQRAIARVIAMKPWEFSPYHNSFTQLSPRNEKASLRVLWRAALRELSDYDTTLEEDEQLLASADSLTFRQLNALRVRMDEKSLLHDFIATIKREMADKGVSEAGMQAIEEGMLAAIAAKKAGAADSDIDADADSEPAGSDAAAAGDDGEDGDADELPEWDDDGPMLDDDEDSAPPAATASAGAGPAAHDDEL